MVTLRRRARLESSDGPSRARQSSASSRIARQRSGNGDGDEWEEDEDEDESGPSINLLSQCMAFTAEHESKHRTKSARLQQEARAISKEYTDTVKAILSKQTHEVEDLYSAYRQAAQQQLDKRAQLLEELAAVNAKLEHIRGMIASRSLAFEMQRSAAVERILEKARKEVQAGHRTVFQSVHKATGRRPSPSATRVVPARRAGESDARTERPKRQKNNGISNGYQTQ